MPFPFSCHRKIEWGRGGSREVDAIRSALAVELQAAGLRGVESSINRITFLGSVMEMQIFAYRNPFGVVSSGEIEVVRQNRQLSVLYSLKFHSVPILVSLVLPVIMVMMLPHGTAGDWAASAGFAVAFWLFVHGISYSFHVWKFNHVIQQALCDLRKDASPDEFEEKPTPQSILQ